MGNDDNRGDNNRSFLFVLFGRIDLSDLGHAAVDKEFDPGDVTTFVGSEEGDYFGYFVQGSGATERYFVHDAVGVFFELFFGHAQGIAVAW
jgi:hypothetical protein